MTRPCRIAARSNRHPSFRTPRDQDALLADVGRSVSPTTTADVPMIGAQDHPERCDVMCRVSGGARGYAGVAPTRHGVPRVFGTLGEAEATAECPSSSDLSLLENGAARPDRGSRRPAPRGWSFGSVHPRTAESGRSRTWPRLISVQRRGCPAPASEEPGTRGHSEGNGAPALQNSVRSIPCHGRHTPGIAGSRRDPRHVRCGTRKPRWCDRLRARRSGSRAVARRTWRRARCGLVCSRTSSGSATVHILCRGERHSREVAAGMPHAPAIPRFDRSRLGQCKTCPSGDPSRYRTDTIKARRPDPTAGASVTRASPVCWNRHESCLMNASIPPPPRPDFLTP